MVEYFTTATVAQQLGTSGAQDKFRAERDQVPTCELIPTPLLSPCSPDQNISCTATLRRCRLRPWVGIGVPMCLCASAGVTL